MEALKELLYKMADDELIFGHRNSEWTGLGPVLEEDIAFSSMAQDKVGHAFTLYSILHEKLGEKDPDTIAFKRNASNFKCCHLVELPISGPSDGDARFDFSLIRHFLFDHAEMQRYTMLSESSYEPLANLSKKIKGELKYHIMHANTWVRKLGKGSEESHARMQSALNEAFPFGLGIFEPGKYEDKLKKEGIFEGEKALQERWAGAVAPVLQDAGLIPKSGQTDPVYGGRQGRHTEWLQPLLNEMTEVISSDPEAEW